MISQETKDQIRKEADEYLRISQPTWMEGNPSSQDISFATGAGIGYSAAATNYAEKLEEKDKIIESKDGEIEKLRLQLAACGVAALSNTEESIKNQRLSNNSEYFSASYEDVCRAVNREMNYRNELAQLKEIAERMAKHLEFYSGLYTETITAYAEWCKQNLK